MQILGPRKLEVVGGALPFDQGMCRERGGMKKKTKKGQTEKNIKGAGGMYNIAGYYTYLTETESWAGAAREGSHTSQKNTYTSM